MFSSPRQPSLDSVTTYHTYIEENRRLDNRSRKSVFQRDWDLKRIVGSLMTNTALFTKNEVRGQNFVSSATQVHGGHTCRWWLWVVMDGLAVEFGDNDIGYTKKSNCRCSWPLIEFYFSIKLQKENMYVKSQEHWIHFVWVCAQMCACRKNVCISMCLLWRPEEDKGCPHVLFLIP